MELERCDNGLKFQDKQMEEINDKLEEGIQKIKETNYKIRARCFDVIQLLYNGTFLHLERDQKIEYCVHDILNLLK